MNARRSLFLMIPAFCAGLLYTLWQKQGGPEPEQPAIMPPSTVSAEAVHGTDTFTPRLLHAALESQEGNILLAPHAIAESLRVLQQFSQGATHEELAALPLPTLRQQAAEEAGEATFLFSAHTLQYCNTLPTDDVIPVPLEGDCGEPLQFLNNLLAQTMGEEHTVFLRGEHLPPNSRLISFNTLRLDPKWQIPLRTHAQAETDFYNEDGSMPRIRTIQCNGHIRQAQAEDGSWQAIALFLRLSPQSVQDECLVLILPTEQSARTFAKERDADLFNTIRRALLAAKPAPLCVEFPRIVFAPPTQDMRPLLQSLGLKTLLSEQADLRHLAGDKPLFLNMALQKCHIPLTESEPQAPEITPELSFNKPFIWMIGSLSSPAPPYALGIVENL